MHSKDKDVALDVIHNTMCHGGENEDDTTAAQFARNDDQTILEEQTNEVEENNLDKNEEVTNREELPSKGRDAALDVIHNTMSRGENEDDNTAAQFAKNDDQTKVEEQTNE